MGSCAEDPVAQTTDDSAGPAHGVIGEPEAVECPAGHAMPGERFSLLAELAKDPANGLEQIRPGVYISLKYSTVPDR